MEPTYLTEITRQGLMVALMVVGPILATALFVGLLISVFQALTQVQEATLTFVPKMLAAALVLAMTGHWMLATLVSFVRTCIEQAGRVTS